MQGLSPHSNSYSFKSQATQSTSPNTSPMGDTTNTNDPPTPEPEPEEEDDGEQERPREEDENTTPFSLGGYGQAPYGGKPSG